MGYNAISFSVGEQPTTAKWNLLGSNDSSFNDGTGIANLEIGSGHTSLKLDYKFSVYRNAAFTPGATAPIQFDTKLYDTGSNVDIVTNKGRFTAPVAGFYSFKAQLTMTYGGAGNVYSVALYKNGAGVKQGLQLLSTAAQTICGEVAADVQLAANDYVEVYNLGASTAITTGPVYSFFDGCLISQT